ncbi:MAG: hypothetical protein R6V85_13845 [Polyangia bacterium]
MLLPAYIIDEKLRQKKERERRPSSEAFVELPPEEPENPDAEKDDDRGDRGVAIIDFMVDPG